MRNFVLTILFLAFGCGSSEYTPGLVEAKVFIDETVSLSQIKMFKFSVEGPGIDEKPYAVVQFPNPDPSRKIELPNIPYGYQRRLIAEVCTNTCNPEVAGDIVAKGASTPFDVLTSSSRKQTSNIYVMLRNSMGRPKKLELPMMESKPTVADRVGATVTTLFDGRILIAGGAKVKKDSSTWFNENDIETIISEVETFDPNTGSFEKVGNMLEPRAFHQAVRLKDGRVLILGGYTQRDDAIDISKSVEVFDPKTNQFAYDKNSKGEQVTLPSGRALFSAFVVENDGLATIIIGGKSSPPAGAIYIQVYYPGAGIIFHSDPKMFPGSSPLKTARWNHSAVYVPDYKRDVDGKGSPAIILFGGENDQGLVNEVEAFTIAPTWPYQLVRDESAVVEMTEGGRTHIASVYIRPHGFVYLVGGFEEKGAQRPSNKIDVYSAASGRFRGALQPMSVPKGACTATLMDRNIIFIAGGLGVGGVLDETALIMERFKCDDPQKMEGCYYEVTLMQNITPKLLEPRAGHLAVFDATGKVLILGGFANNRLSTLGAVYYNPD